jgi:hypothetical protein
VPNPQVNKGVKSIYGPDHRSVIPIVEFPQ